MQLGATPALGLNVHIDFALGAFLHGVRDRQTDRRTGQTRNAPMQDGRMMTRENRRCSATAVKRHSARTGRTVFSQRSAAVVRHKANDGVVYATRAWFKTTILHCLQWHKLVLSTRLRTPATLSDTMHTVCQ